MGCEVLGKLLGSLCALVSLSLKWGCYYLSYMLVCGFIESICDSYHWPSLHSSLHKSVDDRPLGIWRHQKTGSFPVSTAHAKTVWDPEAR